MSRVVFDFARVNARRKAARAIDAALGGHHQDGGWSKSPADPMDLLAVFPPLRIKAGYVLRAYWLRAGVACNGVAWAMPIEAPFPEPEECMGKTYMSPVSRVVLDIPRPPEALDDYMSVIEGDGSPWSYLCASLFDREVRELGARWHGVNWGAHTILRGDPWQGIKGEGEGSNHPPSERSEFTFRESEPETWEPTFHRDGAVPVVTLHTYCADGEERITRLVDRFESDGYCFKTDAVNMATGPGGYIS